VRILALVTARGGSKRVPNKNKRLLGGRPLIEWSIDVAKDIPEISDILVSTDDEEIADISRQAGAMVPWLRPDDLALDTSLSVDVCLHALDWYESEYCKVDGLLLLQPTSPFRSRDSVKRGIKIFDDNRCNGSIIGLSPAKTHPMWCYQVAGNSMSAFIPGVNTDLRSQDMPPLYEINGAFYLITPKYLRKHKSFHVDGALPLVFDSLEESLDIDTEWDWKQAEMVVQARSDKSNLC